MVAFQRIRSFRRIRQRGAPMNTLHHLTVGICLFALVSTVGCAGSPDDTDLDIGEARSPALNANALNANALNANALYSDALTPAMLGAGALVWAQLSSTAQTALQDTGEKGTL